MTGVNIYIWYINYNVNSLSTINLSIKNNYHVRKIHVYLHDNCF